MMRHDARLLDIAYMTAGIQALYQIQAIVARVQAYNDFNAQNDP